MSRKIKQYNLVSALFFCKQGLPYSKRNSMRRLRSRNNTFSTSKKLHCAEHLILLNRSGIYQSLLFQFAHNLTTPMISETGSMYLCRPELMSESIHRNQRGQTLGITIIIFEFSNRKFRTCSRLSCNEFCLSLT